MLRADLSLALVGVHFDKILLNKRTMKNQNGTAHFFCMYIHSTLTLYNDSLFLESTECLYSRRLFKKEIKSFMAKLNSKKM